VARRRVLARAGEASPRTASRSPASGARSRLGNTTGAAKPTALEKKTRQAYDRSVLDVAVIEDPAAAAVALEPIRSRPLAELSAPASAATLAAHYHDATAPGSRAHRLVVVAHTLPRDPESQEPEAKEPSCP
jgi:hypothetical protein